MGERTKFVRNEQRVFLGMLYSVPIMEKQTLKSKLFSLQWDNLECHRSEGESEDWKTSVERQVLQDKCCSQGCNFDVDLFPKQQGAMR